MSMNTVYPHLTTDNLGQAWIGDTRYQVAHLAAEHYQHGWSAEELLRQHTDLRPEEVYAALTYFYDHHDDMVSEMKLSLTEVVAKRPAQQLSREELLRRKEASAE